MPLKIRTEKTFKRSVQIKIGDPEKPNQFITETFIASFAILPMGELEDLTRKNRAEDESDLARVRECLELVLKGAENVQTEGGGEVPSDDAVAAIKADSVYAIQTHSEYWRAIRGMNEQKK